MPSGLYAEDIVPHGQIEIWRGQEVSRRGGSTSAVHETDSHRDISSQDISDELVPRPFNVEYSARPLDVLVTEQDEQTYLTSFLASSLPLVDLELADSTDNNVTSERMEPADTARLLSTGETDPDRQAGPTLANFTENGHPTLAKSASANTSRPVDHSDRTVSDSWNAATREVVASFLGFTAGAVVLTLVLPSVMRRFGDELRPVIRVELINSTAGESLAVTSTRPEPPKTPSTNSWRVGQVQDREAKTVPIRPSSLTLADQQRSDQDRLQKTQLAVLRKIIEQNADIRRRIRATATDRYPVTYGGLAPRNTGRDPQPQVV